MRDWRAKAITKILPRLLGVCFCLWAASVSAADVVIVMSSDAAPYQQAQAVLTERLASPTCNVRSVPVKQLADAGISSSISTTDTVVAVGTPAATWLHNQLPSGILLAYCMVSNPQEAGLLDGSKCWGVTMEVAEAEQFKLISQALPSAKVVGTLYRSNVPAECRVLQNFRDNLPPGWRLEAIAVNDYPGIGAAIDALMAKNIDIVWTSAAFKIYDVAAVRELLVGALRNKVPVWGFSPAFVRAGALIGVGVDPESQAIQAADLVAKLRTDSKSVQKSQPPDQYQLAINMVVADQLNIPISDGLLKQAKYVFRGDQ